MLPPEASEIDERENVIVYLTPASGDRSDAQAPRLAHAEMQQRDERFVPHVLPVVRGATVEFPNEDAVFHNVFSLSSAKSFDLGRYPRGASKSIVFDRVGTIQVFCHIHSDMSAVVLVLPNSLFARPDSSGRFVLDGVPAGDYIVTGWHERIRPITRPLHIEPGRTQTVDFDIPLPPDDRRGR
jgi:plastocyanin